MDIEFVRIKRRSFFRSPFNRHCSSWVRRRWNKVVYTEGIGTNEVLGSTVDVEIGSVDVGPFVFHSPLSFKFSEFCRQRGPSQDIRLFVTSPTASNQRTGVDQRTLRPSISGIDPSVQDNDTLFYLSSLVPYLCQTLHQIGKVMFL